MSKLNILQLIYIKQWIKLDRNLFMVENKCNKIELITWQFTVTFILLQINNRIDFNNLRSSSILQIR